jgi:hypothetical protein
MLGMPLRKIMAFCALLQRMGIFAAERENVPRTAAENWATVLERIVPSAAMLITMTSLAFTGL